jgi:hypothetical protein
MRTSSGGVTRKRRLLRAEGRERRIFAAALVLAGCGSAKTDSATSRAASTAQTPAYEAPDDWNVSTEPGSPSPGVEPLNVIISAASTISFNAIFAGMANVVYPGGQPVQWLSVQVGTGLFGLAGSACISGELSDVPGGGNSYVEEALSYRIDGCAGIVSTNESHARAWLQPSTGAAFLALSNETPCLLGLKPWHCIGDDGYDRGRDRFVNDLRQAAENQGWSVSCENVSRPTGVGLNDVTWDGVASLCTVTPAGSPVAGANEDAGSAGGAWSSDDAGAGDDADAGAGDDGEAGEDASDDSDAGDPVAN